MEFENLLKLVQEEPNIEICEALLLKADKYDRIKKLLETAEKIRDEFFGRNLKLDSFVYPVKKCVMEKYCIYCSNYVEKFRLESLKLEEFCLAIDFLKDCGAEMLTLEGGYNEDNSQLIEYVKISSREGLDVAVDTYPIRGEELDVLRDKVSEIYASIEIAEKELFQYFKPGESFDFRLKLAEEIMKRKISLSSTVLIGLPGTDYRVWLKALFWMKKLGVKHVSISSFQPVLGTPLEKFYPLPSTKVAKFVALARILLKESDITACGSVNDLSSLPLMLLAGVNRAYLGPYVCRIRSKTGFADEVDEIFKPNYEVKFSNNLVFVNPFNAVEKVCKEFDFEVKQ
ncbi:MAG: radical SAM protein [Archaeoglobaceae archaeon]|nr:radical SAM protein [Archaeoglobaceae archaeon]MCX8152726.1 radical SAM protein [Archaeoglobaceae archaeon]MDW8013433.1 radical SAM protein [Archaeoglobaceae archaeon]